MKSLKGGAMAKTSEKQSAKPLNKTTVTYDVMTKLFHVFKDSIRQMNNDKQYFLEKLKFFNDIGEALSDYLKELCDEMAEHDNGKDSEKCKESWRVVLKEQERNLTTLGELADSYRKTIAHLLKQLE
jgi:hypothetical protein